LEGSREIVERYDINVVLQLRLRTIDGILAVVIARS